MMCHADSIKSIILTQLAEIIVSQVACSHLYAHLMQRRISLGVEMCKMQRHMALLTQLFAESLITVRLFTTEMEIAMRRLHLITEVEQNAQQSHTVCTTR